jgi:hypothetical protein
MRPFKAKQAQTILTKSDNEDRIREPEGEYLRCRPSIVCRLISRITTANQPYDRTEKSPADHMRLFHQDCPECTSIPPFVHEELC